MFPSPATYVFLKFGYSEKATKIWPIFHLEFDATGKSLSEVLIFASTNPQYDDRLIPSSNLYMLCTEKLFLTFRTIFVHNMFSLCSARRRASDKDFPVKNPFR